MSIDVAEKLYNVAASIPVMHMEDVYTTGMSQFIVFVPMANRK